MHTRINEIVKKSGLTKTEFAKRLGLSQSHVSRICNGESSPSDRTIADICREFGVDEVWLRTGGGDPFRQETQNEMIMRFAVKTINGSNKFRKALVAMLDTLDGSEWDGLEKLLDKMLEQYKKD